MWTAAGGDRGPAGEGASDPQDKGRRRVAGATGGRQRRAPKEGTDGGLRRRVGIRRWRQCLCACKIWERLGPKGYINPRFGARENGADLG
jgi:hypothetical protein